MLFLLVIRAVAIGAIVWLAWRLLGTGREEDRDAFAIARKRLAKGEITRDEFEQIRRDLEAA